MSRAASRCLVAARGIAVALVVAGCKDSRTTAPREPVATKLAFSVQPMDAVAGAAIAPAVQVALVGEDGKTVTSARGEVTLTLAPNSKGAALAGTTVAVALNGVATFSNLKVTTVGSDYRLAATAERLTSATSDAFDIAPTVAATAAFTTQPGTSLAGQSIPMAVTLFDPFGNVATTSTTLVTLSVPSGNPPLVGTLSATAVNGIATFSHVSIEVAGAGYVVLAQAPGVSPVTSSAFTVRPTDPARLEWTQMPQSAEAMDLVGATRVVVKDRFGNVVDWSNAFVRLELTANPTAAILVGTTTQVSEKGVATFQDIRVDRPGHYKVAATSPSLTTPPEVSLTIRLSLDTIVAGRNHTCGVSVTGFNYCWGANESGQLGDGTNTMRTTPVPVFDPFGAPAARFRQLSAGGSHTCGLTATGEAYCWGSNTHGQLGTGTTDGPQWSPLPVTGLLTFSHLGTGGEHTCGVGSGQYLGTSYCWGRNTHGQLGDGTTSDRPEPTPLTGWQITSLSADSVHTCAVVIATGQDGYCWGDNSFGQLGDGTKTQRLSPRKVSGNLQFVHIEVGARHSCAVTNDGSANSMYCWGANLDGQIGTGTVGGADITTPSLVSGVSPFWISAGGDHTCNGRQCWGRNTEGQLGDGSTTSRASPVLAQGTPNPPFPRFVDVGGRHSCAVLIGTKEAYCWGSNAFGQLGDGTTITRTTAVKVAP